MKSIDIYMVQDDKRFFGAYKRVKSLGIYCTLYGGMTYVFFGAYTVNYTVNRVKSLVIHTLHGGMTHRGSM